MLNSKSKLPIALSTADSPDTVLSSLPPELSSRLGGQTSAEPVFDSKHRSPHMSTTLVDSQHRAFCSQHSTQARYQRQSHPLGSRLQQQGCLNAVAAPAVSTDPVLSSSSPSLQWHLGQRLPSGVHSQHDKGASPMATAPTGPAGVSSSLSPGMQKCARQKVPTGPLSEGNKGSSPVTTTPVVSGGVSSSLSYGMLGRLGPKKPSQPETRSVCNKGASLVATAPVASAESTSSLGPSLLKRLGPKVPPGPQSPGRHTVSSAAKVIHPKRQALQQGAASRENGHDRQTGVARNTANSRIISSKPKRAAIIYQPPIRQKA